MRKRSQRKNSNPPESLLIKNSEETLFSRLHTPSSSASLSGKIKNQKRRFSVTGNKDFLRETGRRFSFFLIGISGNKDWSGSLSLEWYVVPPTGKNLGLDYLTAWRSCRLAPSVLLRFSLSLSLLSFQFSEWVYGYG